MTIYTFVPESSPVRLWGLDSRQRLQRQLRAVAGKQGGRLGDFQWLGDAGEAPKGARVLLLNGLFLFEDRTLAGVLQQFGSVLLSADGAVAAAFVGADRVAEVLEHMGGGRAQAPGGLQLLRASDMEAFDADLRRSTRPLLERLSPERKTELENRLYGNAYKGITDLVTKFVWPRPAKRAVHWCASLRLSPNMVTGFGLLLVVLACYLFLKGHYGWGLLAGWVMTFLDTVDGKLARVTIQSSQFGHLFDHAIDLFHPPFWYICWGLSLGGFQTLGGLGVTQMSWIIVIAYAGGRLVEGVFPLLGGCGIFTWRPFDAWFRLVTARRNPCLILLTLGLVAGRPDWSFVAVTAWSALTSIVLALRLLQAIAVRLAGGRLSSWLNEADVATGKHAYSFAVFGSTRGAYARS